MSEPLQKLKAVLLNKAGFQPVQESCTDRQLRFVGRVSPNKTAQWLRVMERLLVREHEAPWTIDLSKQYFLRGSKLLYGWRMILQGEGVEQYFEDVIATVMSAPTIQSQVEEVRLYGRGNNDASMSGGRGAQPLFSAVVGKALQSRRG